MTGYGYRVGDRHPSADRPVRPGDTVTLLDKPGEFGVVDVSGRGTVLHLVSRGGVRLRVLAAQALRVDR